MSRILLVEDDTWFAAQQRRMLAASGYDVIHAADAQAAMEVIEQQPPHGILLDVLLAYNTAFALLHELQSYDETRSLPVVLYTTQSELLDRTSLEPYGVRAVLDKTTMHPTDTVHALAKAGL